MIEFHPLTAAQTVSRFIRETVEKNGYKRAVLGVSGGIDSAVVLALAVDALGSDQVFALMLPYRLSSPSSLEDATTLCKNLSVRYEKVDISPMVDGYLAQMPGGATAMQIGNFCARQRMAVLYDHSDLQRGLVLGTSNKSELLIGYSTLYGDSAAAMYPIGDLYKTQVFALSETLPIPQAIRIKAPSADLWQDQTDEAEIGMSYERLDTLLSLWVDQRVSAEELVTRGFARDEVNNVIDKVKNSQYKRTMPSVCKMSARSVGIDFRFPRDWGR